MDWVDRPQNCKDLYGILQLLPGSHLNNFPLKTLELGWVAFHSAKFQLKCLDYNQYKKLVPVLSRFCTALLKQSLLICPVRNIYRTFSPPGSLKHVACRLTVCRWSGYKTTRRTSLRAGSPFESRARAAKSKLKGSGGKESGEEMKVVSRLCRARLCFNVSLLAG